MIAPILVAATAFFLLRALEPPKPQIPAPSTLYVLGDSQVANGLFAKELQKRTSTKVFNGGTGGYGINQLRRKWLADLKAHNPDMVLLWAGINDIASKRGAEHVRDNIVALRDEVAPARLVVYTIPPWGGYKPYPNSLKFDETYRANNLIHQIQGITVIDTHLGDLEAGTRGVLNPAYTWRCRSTGRSCDKGQPEGLHFSGAGQRKMADLVERAVPLLPLPKAVGGF